MVSFVQDFEVRNVVEIDQTIINNKIFMFTALFHAVLSCVLGAGRVTGDIIIFLDAHCECTTGWLEPLLYEVKKDRLVIILMLSPHQFCINNSAIFDRLKFCLFSLSITKD